MPHKEGHRQQPSLEDKVMLIENTIVESPRFKRIIQRITECHERSKYTTEPRCLLIIGETGRGKTTIAKYYERKYQRIVNDEGTIITVLRSSVSAPATIKGMASQLLGDLGDPLPERGSIPSLTRRLCRLIKGCRVELIILDEFQHLVDEDKKKVLRSSADWLKHILNETGVPIILMGMPWSVNILRANDQLQRRFSSINELKDFGWSNPTEQQEFTNFLIVLEKALPLPKPSNLFSGQMPLRLFCATQGIISNVKKLISKAAEKAFKKGFGSITNDLLALAYNEELALSAPGCINPFHTDAENLDPFKRPTPIDSGDGVGRRGRHGKNGAVKENISAVLRK